MKKQIQYKYSLALIVALLFFSFEISAANWTNSDQKFDFEKLEQLPVPKTPFPNIPLEHMKNVKPAKDQNGLMILKFS